MKFYILLITFKRFATLKIYGRAWIAISRHFGNSFIRISTVDTAVRSISHGQSCRSSRQVYTVRDCIHEWQFHSPLLRWTGSISFPWSSLTDDQDVGGLNTTSVVRKCCPGRTISATVVDDNSFEGSVKHHSHLAATSQRSCFGPLHTLLPAKGIQLLVVCKGEGTRTGQPSRQRCPTHMDPLPKY